MQFVKEMLAGGHLEHLGCELVSWHGHVIGLLYLTELKSILDYNRPIESCNSAAELCIARGETQI